jgi:hypothetical protein
MKASKQTVGRILLLLGVFLSVALSHFALIGLFPEHDPAANRWAISGATEPSWLQRYWETQSYWLGFAYALSLTFAVYAFLRYRQERFGAAKNLALGGVTYSGVLAVVGCYLIGCCGSPMLAVYLSLFGAGFLPFAKPLVAALTALAILGAWWWLNRQRPSPPVTSGCDNQPGCSCK